MKVIVTAGYGEETTEQGQSERIRYFQGCLTIAGLKVTSITSERRTGGAITLEVPDSLDVEDITRAFLKFATWTARCESQRQGEEISVSFDVRLPGFTESITILGTAY